MEGDGSTQTMSVSGGYITEATISGLKSSTTYKVEVAAATAKGIGPYSDSLTVRTTTSTAGQCMLLAGVMCNKVYQLVRSYILHYLQNPSRLV